MLRLLIPILSLLLLAGCASTFYMPKKLEKPEKTLFGREVTEKLVPKAKVTGRNASASYEVEYYENGSKKREALKVGAEGGDINLPSPIPAP